MEAQEYPTKSSLKTLVLSASRFPSEMPTHLVEAFTATLVTSGGEENCNHIFNNIVLSCCILDRNLAIRTFFFV